MNFEFEINLSKSISFDIFLVPNEINLSTHAIQNYDEILFKINPYLMI